MADCDEPIFQDLKAGVENLGATEIESLCVNCFENVSQHVVLFLRTTACPHFSTAHVV